MKRVVTFALLVLAGWNSRLLFADDAADPFTPPNIPQPTFDQSKSYDVKDFGATGDGKTNDTASINKAIEEANADGGGIVKFSAGTYLVASVHIKSNVELLLDDDAAILGGKNGYDAPEPNEFSKYQDSGHSHYHNAVMWGEEIENFAIVGGKVSGGGTSQGDKTGDDGGNKVIAVKTGKNLLFKNITHNNGGHFVYLLNDCQNITIENVIVKKSRDGIDLMGCRNVAVDGCNFTGCGDDTLGVKSDWALGKKIDSENIYAWNDYFESNCNGLQFGSETAGDFKHVFFWDIKIGKGGKSGIGITTCDGAVIDDVHYKNITMSNVTTPIFLEVNGRLRTGDKDAKPGTIKNITMENITATNVVGGKGSPGFCATLSGLPDSIIENVSFKNVTITYKGGETPSDITPPYPKDYSPRSLGPRPASGFYARNAKNISFENFVINYENADPRSPLVFSNIDGLTLQDVKVQPPPNVQTMKLDKVTHVEVQNSPGLADAKDN